MLKSYSSCGTACINSIITSAKGNFCLQKNNISEELTDYYYLGNYLVKSYMNTNAKGLYFV